MDTARKACLYRLYAAELYVVLSYLIYCYALWRVVQCPRMYDLHDSILSQLGLLSNCCRCGTLYICLVNHEFSVISTILTLCPFSLCGPWVQNWLRALAGTMQNGVVWNKGTVLCPPHPNRGKTLLPSASSPIPTVKGTARYSWGDFNCAPTPRRRRRRKCFMKATCKCVS